MTTNNQVAEASVKYLAEANGKLSVENGELKDLSHSRLPKGYKQTEVGVIPEDWDVKSGLNIFTKIQDGTHFSPKVAGGEFLYVTSKNIKNGYLDLASAGFIDRKQHEAIYRRCDVREGDILLTKDGANTGNAALNTIKGEFSLLSSVAFLRLDPKLHSAQFFLQQILSSDFQAYIQEEMSGNAITRLTLQKINNLKFFFPTKEEQSAIANALSDVDALISELEKLIGKKQAIKTATMQQLLTGRIRLTSGELKIENGKRKSHSQFSTLNSQLTKQSELGEIPEDWEVKNIGQLFTITAGGDLRKNEYSADQTEIYKYPIFSNAISNKGLYGYCTDYDYCGSYLTITARGGIGHAVARINEFCAIGRLLVLKPISYSSCKFFEEFINQYIEFANESTGVPQLTAPQVAKYSVIVPDEKEQTAIATILSDMDAEIQTLQQRLAKTRQIKQGMMQELLTGKTRLKQRSVNA